MTLHNKKQQQLSNNQGALQNVQTTKDKVNFYRMNNLLRKKRYIYIDI